MRTLKVDETYTTVTMVIPTAHAAKFRNAIEDGYIVYCCSAIPIADGIVINNEDAADEKDG